MPRVAVRRPARKRFCSGVGGGGGVGIDSVTARVESGGGSGCCAPSEVAATQSNTARQRIKWSSIVVGRSPGYNVTMTVPATSRQTRTFEDRADALAHFLRATHGLGAVISMLGRRPPELRHIRRWLQAVFAEPAAETGSTQMLAGWFATGSAGVVFLPRRADDPYTYCEVGLEG